MPELRAGFVGREAELDALEGALDRAVRFQTPQAITIVGGLGTGKTRLVDEWLARNAGTGLRVVRAAATREAAPQALVRGLLRARFRLDQGIEGDEAISWFRSELQGVFGDRRVAEVASLLGGFLGFEMPESPLSQALAARPEQGAELARAVLCRFLEQDALAQPLVLVAEDLHAADDASLDLLQNLPAELGEAPILLIGTARMDLLVRRPTWAAGRADGSWGRLDLAPLAQGDFGDESVDVDLSPLAVELAAEVRVASLSPAERDVLSRGAVFGGVFWTGGIVALGRLGGAPADDAAVFAPDPAIAEIRDILARLADRDFIVRLDESSLPGETAWGFKHAREQTLVETAVAPALARQRRLFAAQWLESRAGEGREQRLEALARLYEGGGDARRAAYCYATAAADARARHLLDRAHVLYGAAVRLLDLEDAVAKMDALYALGDLSTRLGRTHEAVAHFGEMLRLAWHLDLPAKGGAAHGRLGRLHHTLGAPRQALVHLELARRLFEVAGDAPGVAAALDDIGRIHLVSGAPDASLACHRAALAVREQLGDDRGRALALARLGQAEQEIGNLAAAGEHFRDALALRRRVGDRQGEVASLLDLGGLALDLGAIDEAVARLEEGRALAREHGERLFEASLAIELGECHLAAGQPLRARREYDGAREIARQFGARVLTCEATRGLAEAELALGDLRRARDDARAAFDMAERMGAAPLVGAALRVVAAAVGLGAPGEADLGGAREMFDRAVEVLSNAGAELELARTLAAYADFEASVGRKDTAHELRRQADTIRAHSRGTKRPRAGRSAPELALH